MPSFSTSWTLESGPDDAPSCMDIKVEYDYRWGTLDSWMEPGDPAECEVGKCYGENEFGEEVTLSLVLQGEQGFLDYIANNPPEPNEPDYDYSY